MTLDPLTLDATRAALDEYFQPIGCGTPLGRFNPTTCGDRGICSACWSRRNQRDKMLALIDKVEEQR